MVSSVPSSVGVVLAGGRSSRMGSPKVALEWHGSTLLRRVTGLLERGVDAGVVVVRAPGQALPTLEPRIVVVEDAEPGRGPLQGLAAGLAAAGERAETAFVCSTDLPFLHPAFVRAVLRRLDDATDVALPVVRGYRQPLAAAYRNELAPLAAKLLDEGRDRPAHLFEECRVSRLDDADLLTDGPLAAADPSLMSVVNLNDVADYESARSRPAPAVTVECFGMLASRGRGRGPHAVEAATVGAAGALVGLVLDGHVLAAVNGDQVAGGPELPLVTGDRVSFISADAGG
jgi:molybdopterin-guanine dinucleotide biosynthesis protein A